MQIFVDKKPKKCAECPFCNQQIGYCVINSTSLSLQQSCPLLLVDELINNVLYVVPTKQGKLIYTDKHRATQIARLLKITEIEVLTAKTQEVVNE